MNKKKPSKGQSVSAIAEIKTGIFHAVRKFRWTLSSTTLSEGIVAEKLEVDHLRKQIKFSLYKFTSEDRNINAYDFCKDILKSGSSPLYLDSLTGAGEFICTEIFTGLKVLECKEQFDYSSSDIGTIDFIIGYDLIKIDVNSDEIKNKPEVVNLKVKSLRNINLHR